MPGFDDPRQRVNTVESPLLAVSGSPVKNTRDVDGQTGLTSDEALARLEKFGFNAMPDTSAHPLRRALGKFWAPVP